MTIRKIIVTGCLAGALLLGGCRKLIRINPPNDSITTDKVFSADAQVQSAMAGLYNNLVNNTQSFSSSDLTMAAGLGADELLPFNLALRNQAAFLNNELLSDNPVVLSLWQTAYSAIYSCNAMIENLQPENAAISAPLKQRLMAEAKFIRAYCYLTLLNLYGPVPLVQSTNWQNTSLQPRAAAGDVYAGIIEDLLSARQNLPDNYSASGGERILPTRWAAGALLARVYMYTKNWAAAITEADTLLNGNALFQLEPLDNVFGIKSREAIWQLKQDRINGAYPFASPLGYLFIPPGFNAGIPPDYYLTESLLNAFSAADQRLSKWVKSTVYTPTGTLYYIPYKYKAGKQAATQYTEYHTPLRLAEVYLLRAEAWLHTGKPDGARKDLDMIRQRAGLTPLPADLSNEGLMDSLVKERRLELFCEFGNRWFDLKRWNRSGEVLSKKPDVSWQATDTLLPVPYNEIVLNPNIHQNPGYTF